MRLTCAAAIAAAIALTSAVSAQERDEPTVQLTAAEIASFRDTLRPAGTPRQDSPKPGGEGGAAPIGDDSCEHARDNECDEPGVGTGACPSGTDHTDCQYLLAGETDSCQHANDGECDEPGFGTGACPQGSDRTDCGDVSHLRYRTDSCPHAFNGTCDEPGAGGNDQCEARTDRTDCVGTARPETINDHFFGDDDRRVMPTDQMPWQVIGEIRFESGGACTATLIAEDVLATAAHCVAEADYVDARATFTTGFALPGGPRSAQVTDFFLDPNFDYGRFSSTNDIDGLDWALLRIDQPLGAELGFVEVRPLVNEFGAEGAREIDIYQAGYSWDTGENLSGNNGTCHILIAYPDNTMSHDCDTTRGDSGSPFMWREGDTYYLMGTDSNFRSNPSGPFIYIAVLAESFADYVPRFVAGEIGNGGPVSDNITFPSKPGMMSYEEAGGAAAGGFDGDPVTPKTSNSPTE